MNRVKTRNGSQWFKGLAVLLAVMAGLMAGSVEAASIPVLNPSFESPVLDDGGISGSITNWTQEANWTQQATESGGSGTFYPNSAAFNLKGDTLLSPANGKQCALFHGQYPIIYQNTWAVIEANRTYTLTVAIGHRIGYAGVGQWSISLRDSALHTIAILQRGGSGAAPDPEEGNWTNQTVSFTTLGGTNAAYVGQALVVFLGSNGGDQFGVDNVRLEVVPAPKPSSALGTGTGAGFLGPLAWWIRR